MKRRIVALLFAPALVPLLMLGDLLAWATTKKWFVIYVIVSTIIAYAGALLLGAPILLFAWSRRHTALWMTLLIGVSVAMITWMIFGILFSLSLGHPFSAALKFTFELSFLKGIAWPAGVCGAVVSIVIWTIVRPDRQYAAQVMP